MKMDCVVNKATDRSDISVFELEAENKRILLLPLHYSDFVYYVNKLHKCM